MGRLIPPDVLILADNVQSPGRLADLILANLGVEVEEAQHMLELRDPLRRLRKVGELLNKELEMMAMQHKIQSEAREEMSKTQREYFLREQLKVIQREFGEVDARAADLLALRECIDQAELPAVVEQECRKQLTRLERMHPEAAEASMVRDYLEWLVELPWTVTTTDHLDLHEARRVLEEDHYGLEQVKERILEYLGVCKLKEQMNGPMLCFVGPPGVGKTSLGQIDCARPGRNFVRLSLGGIRDEAEIRGHRRTHGGCCRGAFCRACTRQGRPIRCSCWTRSINSAWTFAAIRQRRFWRCSILSRITPLAITISGCRSICRASCLSLRRISLILFPGPCVIAWRSSPGWLHG